MKGTSDCRAGCRATDRRRFQLVEPRSRIPPAKVRARAGGGHLRLTCTPTLRGESGIAPVSHGIRACPLDRCETGSARGWQVGDTAALSRSDFCHQRILRFGTSQCLRHPLRVAGRSRISASAVTPGRQLLALPLIWCERRQPHRAAWRPAFDDAGSRNWARPRPCLELVPSVC